jgi:hypothetical protein
MVSLKCQNEWHRLFVHPLHHITPWLCTAVCFPLFSFASFTTREPSSCLIAVSHFSLEGVRDLENCRNYSSIMCVLCRKVVSQIL